MILPILAYGSPVLKKIAKEITSDYPNLNQLIDNMWETMYASDGVGLAAPQIGISIRMFIIDASPVVDEELMDEKEVKALSNFKKIFINPKIISEDGNLWDFNEGCLSIPEVREDVLRKEEILITFFNENFECEKLKLNGLAARVVQHEYDHIEGVLFTEKIKPLRKRLIKGALGRIERGGISAGYPMKFPKAK